MDIHHHGVVTHLEESDPRVAVIQTLLYGRPLPAPFPLPSVAAPAPALPDNVVRFWRALDAFQKKELVLLAERPHTPAEMEAALGVTQQVLRGRHGSLARLALAHGVPVRIRSRGRARAQRRYWIDDATAALVRQMAG